MILTMLFVTTYQLQFEAVVSSSLCCCITADFFQITSDMTVRFYPGIAKVLEDELSISADEIKRNKSASFVRLWHNLLRYTPHFGCSLDCRVTQRCF